MRRRKAWTDKEEATLLEMRAAGASWKAIAESLDRTKMSVEVRAAEIRRRNPGVTSEPRADD
ncbi:DNA-binding NarL/FixJ family response regulator [Bradyrhizobium sp. LB7.1]